MSENTVRIHRILRTKPERVYSAFLHAEAMARWLPPYGFTCTVHHFEPVEGGTFKMSFRDFSTGNAHSFGGEYLELVPNKLIRYTNKFEDPNMPGVMSMTVELREVICGTELTVIQANIPELIPVEMCYLGWQESLLQLAALVERDNQG
jgi:uncharacterized protein YndB with AHSA1/START domain